MRLVFLALFSLTACTPSPAERAQKDVAFLESHGGTHAELCEAYGRLADAERAAENATEWEAAKAAQDAHCLANAADNLAI